MASNNVQKVVIDRDYFDSKLGRIVIYADKIGIVKLEHDGQVLPAGSTGKLEAENTGEIHRQIDNGAQKKCKNQHIETCILWLQQYFKDPSKMSDVQQPALSTRLHQTKPFLVKVWNILREKSKPGQSITYGKLAFLAGNPKAVRSVGLAMRRNPFPLIVPCHRVIKSDAKLGNYSWLNGTETKKWLLDHEKAFCCGVTDGEFDQTD